MKTLDKWCFPSIRRIKVTLGQTCICWRLPNPDWCATLASLFLRIRGYTGRAFLQRQGIFQSHPVIHRYTNTWGPEAGDVVQVCYEWERYPGWLKIPFENYAIQERNTNYNLENRSEVLVCARDQYCKRHWCFCHIGKCIIERWDSILVYLLFIIYSRVQISHSAQLFVPQNENQRTHSTL